MAALIFVFVGGSWSRARGTSDDIQRILEERNTAPENAEMAAFSKEASFPSFRFA